jgi:hypothetical protein
VIRRFVGVDGPVVVGVGVATGVGVGVGFGFGPFGGAASVAVARTSPSTTAPPTDAVKRIDMPLSSLVCRDSTSYNANGRGSGCPRSIGDLLTRWVVTLRGRCELFPSLLEPGNRELDAQSDGFVG